MTALASDLKPHLRRYVVDQAYEQYTPRDQAVWRHIMKRLKTHLESKAHGIYLRGLVDTGIDVERIPRIEAMNERLQKLGWRCVGVRGFIPPAVFTELQAHGILAIAADIRTHKHLAYTPAPDIVHESAGHAPIIADAEYAAYLKACGEVGFKAIASAEDRALFEAIRNLSVVKEDPFATPEDVAHAEARLSAASASGRYVSESTRASRLYWWTAEYGLVGSLESPKLFGAGLLSSIGEAVHCLTPEVKKLPLTPACGDVSYDITRMQPQLFVARDFRHLNEVLEQFKSSLAYVRGGDSGLEEALRSRAINHVVVKKAGGDSLEVSGIVSKLHRFGSETGPGLTAAVIELSGPTMVSKAGRCTERPKRIEAVLLIGAERLPSRGRFSFRLASGVECRGFVVGGHEVIDFQASHGGQPLALPTWCTVVIAEAVPSVAGGPADTAIWDEYFGALDSFSAGQEEALARSRKADELSPHLAALYTEVRELRERGGAVNQARLAQLKSLAKDEALLSEEVAELHA